MITDWPRTTTVADVNQFDIGHVVRFRRPANADGRPEILGKLVKTTQATYYRGMMPKTGYVLEVAFQSQYSGFNFETFGPLPGHFPIWIGKEWVYRKSAFERSLDEQWAQYDTPNE